jgi:hypothetical protein
MSVDTHITSDKLPKPRRASRAALRSAWRLWVVCFAALAFVLLVSTAATHPHASLAAAHDCAICTAVADKIGGTPTPPTPAVTVQLQPYLLFFVAPYLALYVAPRVLPPGCGPPAHPV